MTLIDLIKLGIVRNDAMAEKFAADLIDCWHNDQIPGELNDVLGVTQREYQAWATGGVSLLTIARWQSTSRPPLDISKPWFKLSGRPPHEAVGYLEQKNSPRRKKGGKRAASKKKARV